MKSVAVVLNTNQLGGAERSMIEQCALMRDHYDITFYHPRLGSDESSLQAALARAGIGASLPIPFPAALYRVSRRNVLSIVWGAVAGAVLLAPAVLAWRRTLRGADVVYANGNKALFPALAAVAGRADATLVWHFRDYPAPSFFRHLGKWVPRLLGGARLRLIANSEDVARAVRVFFSGHAPEVLYNLPGDMTPAPMRPRVERVVVMSMLAPWKGIHEVVLMAGLYDRELRALGVREVVVYGAGIYQTDAGEQGHESQLRALAQDVGAGLVRWGGVRAAAEILAEADILVHSSILPEPFGRVIVEAQKAGVPVISTALGGAAELVRHGSNGLTYLPHDYQGLFDQIKSLVQDTSIREELITGGKHSAEGIEISVRNKALSISLG